MHPRGLCHLPCSAPGRAKDLGKSRGEACRWILGYGALLGTSFGSSRVSNSCINPWGYLNQHSSSDTCGVVNAAATHRTAGAGSENPGGIYLTQGSQPPDLHPCKLGVTCTQIRTTILLFNLKLNIGLDEFDKISWIQCLVSSCLFLISWKQLDIFSHFFSHPMFSLSFYEKSFGLKHWHGVCFFSMSAIGLSDWLM